MAFQRHVPARYDSLSIAAVIVLAMLVVSLLVGLLVPIYSDEVTWRMLIARGALDGGVDRGLSDQCGRETARVAPLFMQPVRYLSAWIAIHFPDPRAVRISGVALTLIWVAIFWRLTRFLDGELRAAGRTIGLSLLGLGVLPFLLVWSRPERPLLIIYTLLLMIALKARTGRDPTPRLEAAGWALAVTMLGLVALSYHPKAMAFAPIALVAAALSSRGRATRLMRIAAIVVLIASTPVASRYWGSRFACPAEAGLAAMLARENVASKIDRRAPLASVELLAQSVMPWRYVKLAAPSADFSYMSGWLPTVIFSPALNVVWRAASRIPWYAAIGATLILLLGGAITGIRRAPVDPRYFLALTVTSTCALWSASQLNKNAYESSMLLPLAAIAFILALPVLPQRFRFIVIRCAMPLAAVAIASQILLLGVYGPALTAVAAKPGPIAGEPYSYVPWGYPKVREQIIAAARACALDPVRGRQILVDDLTYFPMMQSREPISRMTVFGPWYGGFGDRISYMRTHVSGAVIACDYLTPEARSQAKRTGEFCCLGPWAGVAR